MKRLWLPLGALVFLGIAHWLLGAVLVRQEPLAAVLTGRYWVAVVAASLLATRLLLFFAVVPWILYRALDLCRLSRAVRGTGASAPRSPDQR